MSGAAFAPPLATQIHSISSKEQLLRIAWLQNRIAAIKSAPVDDGRGAQRRDESEYDGGEACPCSDSLKLPRAETDKKESVTHCTHAVTTDEHTFNPPHTRTIYCMYVHRPGQPTGPASSPAPSECASRSNCSRYWGDLEHKWGCCPVSLSSWRSRNRTKTWNRKGKRQRTRWRGPERSARPLPRLG